MNLVTYYTNDLKYYWDSQKLAYVRRDREGPKGFDSLFKPIIDKYWDPSTIAQDFVKPYMWHCPPHNTPPSQEEIDACGEAHCGAQLTLQCTMYCGDDGETFKGAKVELTDLGMLRELWDQLEDWGIKRSLPVIASVTVSLE